MVGFRRAGAADVEAVRGLVRRAYAPWVPIVGREPLPMNADYEAAVREHVVDLLEIDGATAGLVEFVHDGSSLSIENVAVDPIHQGKGYGRMLVAHAEDAAVRLGASRVTLYTNALMHANLELYASLGYGVEREDASHGWAVVYMSKNVLIVADA